MEEETFFEEELTTLEEILDFRESGFSNKIQIKDFRNLHDILKDFQESPFELDSNTRVFLIDENKMNLFKTELKNLASKVVEIEKFSSSELEEKMRIQEENRFYRKQIQDLTDQNMILLRSNNPQSADNFKFPKTKPIYSFEPKGPVNYPSLQNLYKPQILQKPPSFSDLPNCYFCNLLEIQITELKKNFEMKEQENKDLVEKLDVLSTNFNRLLKEKSEASNWENSEKCWRLQSQIENQKNMNINLHTQIECLKGKLRFYEQREKENLNGLSLIKDKITESFADLIDDGFETTSSDCDNEIICRYFPETMKRLKLKLQNESLKEKLEEISKDLNEQKADNIRKVEGFLKEVMHFEEIKENTLKKIDEYLTMIRELAEEKIKKFNLNIDEFKLVDLRCLEFNQKLEGSFKLIEELTEKLGRNAEITRTLMQRYEMDILVNKTFLEDLSKMSEEKKKIEQEFDESRRQNIEKNEKSKREIENIRENVKLLEKNNKFLSIENELLNLTSKRCNEAINFQLFQHFKLKYENIELENQVLINKMKLNQETIAQLNQHLQRKNEEISQLKAKIAENHPDNLLLTLVNIKDGSLRELIQENLDNRKNIVDLKNEIEILTNKINERRNMENQFRYFFNDEIDVEGSPEDKNKMTPLSIIELLEKSKILLSLGSKNQISE